MLPPGDRVIMVSGANRGIGRAVAERLAVDGYRLSLGARDPAALDAVASGLDPARRLQHRHEARQRDTALAWVAATVAEFGRLDGLVLNAGMLHRFSVENDDEALLDEMWEVNVKGPYRLINAAFPHLKACGSGRVVTIASLSGKRLKSAEFTGYGMSKFAAIALSHGARYAGWSAGLRATAICPGYVRSDMTAAVTELPHAAMTQPDSVAALVSTVLALPNTASVSELPVNCVLDHTW